MGATIKSIITLTMILSLFLSMIVSPIQGFLQNENKLLFSKSMFPQSDAYKTGWAAGFLSQPFKGHHTRDYIYGFLNGTSIYVYNYNDTGGGHNLDWYIGFHNGAANADDQYQKEYHLGCKAGFNTDANERVIEVWYLEE
ncbi:MAG: hypothetical protein WA364_10500 [Candidatus Nitrosopolaris sp.]